VLFLRDDGTLLVGEAASRRAVVEPDRQARDFKRRMGDEVPILLGDDRRMSAHELTGHLLRWVVDTVSEREGERPGHLVLTHPAEWGDYRRDLLVAAAGTAGLHDVGLLPEPVAAAAWYAAQERVAPGAFIGIYDLGGGTFDASVVRKTDTGFEVYGEPGGDETIGGLNFDHILLRYVAAAAGVDLAALDDTDLAVASALAQFRDAVVDAKEALSADVEVTIPVLLPGLAQHVTISRTQFESLVRPQILSTVQLFEQIVARAGVEPERLQGVLLVGGSSRIPLVSQLLRAELGVRVAIDAHPKYAVSLGAAITSAPHVEPVLPHAQPVPPHGEPVSPFALPGTAITMPAPPTERPAWDGPTVERPTVDSPTIQTPIVPPPIVEVGGSRPTVVQTVNLAQRGLTAPTDVTIAIPRLPDVHRPPVTDRDVPVVVRTGAAGSGYWGRGLLTAAAVVVVIVAVVAVIAAVALRGPSHPPVGTATTPANTATSTAPGAATARLAGQLVTDPTGVDEMNAAAVLPSGDLVAVGQSVDLLPRAWLRHGNAWRYVAPPANGKAVIADVAVAGTRVVAVGWSGDSGSSKHPAVWSSTNGDAWKLVTPSADLRADGVVELTAVVAATGGGFLATGVDRKTDSVGDVVVFRSADGTQWTRLKAVGLDGPGPQTVHRITVADGKYVAVGASLAGAHLGPAIWTSTDGEQWQPAVSAPPGSPTLWSIARSPEGLLLSCGSIGTVERPVAGCWVQRDDTWEPLDVVSDAGSPAALYLYGLVVTPTGLMAVGAGRDESGVDAGAWRLLLQSR